MRQIIFARRQSPDWGRLSSLFDNFGSVDPSEYIPLEKIPGFPDDLQLHIESWNRIFGVNYFRCRQLLKEISGSTISKVPNATLVRYDELAPGRLSIAEDALVFFFDDDDWFAPVLTELCTHIPEDADICTFPLPLIGAGYLTLVHPDQHPIGEISLLGAAEPFTFRFHTNNYCIGARSRQIHELLDFKDHVEASVRADALQLNSLYIPRIVSASVKTPASAGIIKSISKRTAFLNYLTEFISDLRGIEVDDELRWLQAPIDETASLFEAVRESERKVC
jgi:hypothetical protein